jgi:hypothetical protein
MRRSSFARSEPRGANLINRFALSEAAAALRMCERSLAHFGPTYHAAMCAARATLLQLQRVISGGAAGGVETYSIRARARELLELAARLATLERTQPKLRAAEELLRLPELQVQ